jgi:hypothetical protein
VLLDQLLKRNAAEAKTNWKGEKREMGLAKTNFFSQQGTKISKSCGLYYKIF